MSTGTAFFQSFPVLRGQADIEPARVDQSHTTSGTPLVAVYLKLLPRRALLLIRSFLTLAANVILGSLYAQIVQGFSVLQAQVPNKSL